MSAAPDARFECWVIYFNPKDFPGLYVLRHWTDRTPDLEALVGKDLDALREHVPQDCVRLDRWPDDDPAIFEVWI